MRDRSCNTTVWARTVKAALTAPLLVASVLAGPTTPAAANDLLVAPTRVEFEGRARSTEVILKNVGEKAATYRISLVLRRMDENGMIADVENPSEAEALAEKMIRFAPRRVTLEPGAPQAIRIAVRKPAGLEDGEYRVHMLFRAIPDPIAADEQAEQSNDGLSIVLRPIYGVTIPVIVRHGKLEGASSVQSARLESRGGENMLRVAMARTGERSTYGDFEVVSKTSSEIIGLLRGVAVYPEIRDRKINVPLREVPAGALSLRYFEMRGGERVLVDEVPVTRG